MAEPTGDSTAFPPKGPHIPDPKLEKFTPIYQVPLPEIPQPPDALPGARDDGSLEAPTMDIRINPDKVLEAAKKIDGLRISLINQLNRIDQYLASIPNYSEDEVSKLVVNAWQVRLDAPGDTAYVAVASKFLGNLDEMMRALRKAANLYKLSDSEKEEVFKNLGADHGS